MYIYVHFIFFFFVKNNFMELQYIYILKDKCMMCVVIKFSYKFYTVVFLISYKHKVSTLKLSNTTSVIHLKSQCNWLTMLQYICFKKHSIFIHSFENLGDLQITIMHLYHSIQHRSSQICQHCHPQNCC